VDQSPALADRVLLANREAPSLDALRAQATGDSPGDYELTDSLLFCAGRLVLPAGDPVVTDLIRETHSQVSTAHPGREKTYQLLRHRYYWPRMRNDIDQYIRNCHDCQRAHVWRDRAPGYLNPLPIPQHRWQHITMDYKSCPKDQYGYDNVFVVVDRLSKQAISVPCYKTTDSKGMARLFTDRIYRYFGPPDSIVSDRGPQFISEVWGEFCRILGIQISLSTADHPQTDGQTEVMNQYLDQRLRPFVNYYQDNWSELLPMMDYAQLTLPHSSLGGMSPFELSNTRLPRTSFDWSPPAKPPTSASAALARQEGRAMAKVLEDALAKAQGFIRKAQDKKRRDVDPHRRAVDFGVGDKVWISTKPWSTQRPSRKLDHQAAGPFEILEQVGHSWRVQLPDSIKVHNVFHSSRLRKAPDDPLPDQVNAPPPPIQVTDAPEYEVEEVLASKVTRKTLFYHVKWTGHDTDLEWYPAADFKYAPQKLKDFHAAYPAAAGPPRLLDQWITAYADGLDTYEHLDDSAPAGVARSVE